MSGSLKFGLTISSCQSSSISAFSDDDLPFSLDDRRSMGGFAVV